jgi:hypothetical protein
VELLARVTAATTTSSITVTSPIGGEVWQRGTTHTVTWSSQGNPGSNVKFDLYRDHGSTFDRTIIASVANTGSYNWPIAQDLPERSDYRVQITSNSDPTIVGQSERSFTVIAPSTQAVLSVTPSNRSVDSGSGNTTFSVSNAGSGTLTWNASVTSGSNWLSIASGSSGTNSGTINVSFAQNTSTAPRTGSIRIEASDANESPKDVTVSQAGGTTFVEQLNSEIPSEYHLSQNYPNPFNPITTIEFSIPKSGPVILTIYNSLGMEITVLVNQYLPPGRYRTQWAPQNMPSGAYFYRLRSVEFYETRKLTLIR